MDNIHKIYEDFDRHLMENEKPSDYFNKMLESGNYPDVYPFTMLSDLITIHQSPKHHPEGSVWNHTMLVIDHAAQRKNLSSQPRVLMWSALLHDIGKAPTTKVRKGRITSYDHDKWGKKLSIKFLDLFTKDQKFITKVAQMVRWHMQILFVAQNLPFAEIDKMISQVEIDEIALLSLCDRLGRGGIDQEKEREIQRDIEYFTRKCQQHMESQKRR